ncbi:MAG: leucine-rich repeat domain-containing protein [Alphaproteobacteria bacterium]|nr:MAG: leucine-rich repeat domain-containing protein [Alphaproteobacteria bacterium]
MPSDNKNATKDALVGVWHLDQETIKDLQKLRKSRSRSFGRLVSASGLNPSRSFIGADLSGLPFGAARWDIRGFNFTDADLRGTGLRDAVLDETTILVNATLDPEDAAALLDRGSQTGHWAKSPPADFDLEEVHRRIIKKELLKESWLPWITELDFPGEKLSDISDVSRLPNLTSLNLTGTQVTDLSPLAGLQSLTRLDLSWTGVTDVSPLAGLQSLTMLELRATSVTDVSPLAGLQSLVALYLSWTKATDVSALAGLQSLIELDLSETGVTDVSPLAGLQSLTHLYLGGTRVIDLSPLAGLRRLRKLIGPDGQEIDPQTLRPFPKP